MDKIIDFIMPVTEKELEFMDHVYEILESIQSEGEKSKALPAGMRGSHLMLLQVMLERINAKLGELYADYENVYDYDDYQAVKEDPLEYGPIDALEEIKREIWEGWVKVMYDLCRGHK